MKNIQNFGAWKILDFDKSSTKTWMLGCWRYSHLCDPGKPMHKLEQIKQDIPDHGQSGKVKNLVKVIINDNDDDGDNDNDNEVDNDNRW